MKKIILTTLLVGTAALAFAGSPAKDVVGVWRSNEHDTVIGSGAMTFTAAGAVTLAPDGFDPLTGTYTVQGPFIDIKTERGNASLAYTVKNGHMTVEYENGSVQHFIKTKAAGPAPSQVKKVKKP